VLSLLGNALTRHGSAGVLDIKADHQLGGPGHRDHGVDDGGQRGRRGGDGVGKATSMKISGLERSTGYTIRVAAVSDVGTGAWLTTFASTREPHRPIRRSVVQAWSWMVIR
jgi:hypothetical protein